MQFKFEDFTITVPLVESFLDYNVTCCFWLPRNRNPKSGVCTRLLEEEHPTGPEPHLSGPRNHEKTRNTQNRERQHAQRLAKRCHQKVTQQKNLATALSSFRLLRVVSWCHECRRQSFQRDFPRAIAPFAISGGGLLVLE